MSNSFDYTDVNGRTYRAEKNTGPLPVRRDQIKKLAAQQRISAADLWRIELFLNGEKVDPRATVSDEERMQMVEKYGLVKENEVQKTARWVGDSVAVFDKICEQWPEAARFKKYAGVLYAMKYGDTPCKVYNEKDTK